MTAETGFPCSPRGRKQPSLMTVPTPRRSPVPPAALEACGLSPRRSIAMVKVAREVASGRSTRRTQPGTSACWRSRRSAPDDRLPGPAWPR